jgi:2-C-methyl-D-erythritol 4-phosphate cytidylyltransferase
MTIWPLVPAAGVGSRMQADRPKQYLSLGTSFLIDHTLRVLLDYPGVERLVLVLADDDPYWHASHFYQDPRIVIASGGRERCDSVLNGLQALEGVAADNDWVLVHDVARPCLRHSDLDRLLGGLAWPGAILASPTRDTMKRGEINTRGEVVIAHTVEREQLWHALTPQVFPLGLLREALQRALVVGKSVTDEASAIEMLGLQPLLIAGRADNIKVTRPEDLALAELFLQGD